MSAKSVAIEIIKPFESCKLTAYLCPAGVWTIGWGSTGPEIVKGLKWTQEQADNRLMLDVVRFERGVKALVKVSLSDNQLGALISFAYNVGLGNLQASTLLKLLNAGDYKGAANQFARWNKAAGKVLAGLTRRRAIEKGVFDGL